MTRFLALILYALSLVAHAEDLLWKDNKLTPEQPFPGKVCAVAPLWSLQKVTAQGSAKALARDVIADQAARTIVADPPRGTREEKIAAVAKLAGRRLNALLLSGKKDEEMVVSYAILLLDQQIAYAAKNDGVGKTYFALVANRRCLAERLFELDEAKSALHAK